jgi:hypothetical protein
MPEHVATMDEFRADFAVITVGMGHREAKRSLIAALRWFDRGSAGIGGLPSWDCVNIACSATIS